MHFTSSCESYKAGCARGVCPQKGRGTAAEMPGRASVFEHSLVALHCDRERRARALAGPLEAFSRGRQRDQRNDLAHKHDSLKSRTTINIFRAVKHPAQQTLLVVSESDEYSARAKK